MEYTEQQKQRPWGWNARGRAERQGGKGGLSHTASKSTVSSVYGTEREWVSPSKNCLENGSVVSGGIVPQLVKIKLPLPFLTIYWNRMSFLQALDCSSISSAHPSIPVSGDSRKAQQSH